MKKILYIIMLLTILNFSSTSFADSQEDICICKEVISIFMEQDSSSMRGDILENGIPSICYNAKDGTLLHFKCQLLDGIAYWTTLPEPWTYNYPTYYYIDSGKLTLLNTTLGIWKTVPCPH